MQAYRTMTAAMMRIMILVTSPPKYAPTSAAALSSCNSDVAVGLGCGSGVQEGVHTLTMVAV